MSKSIKFSLVLGLGLLLLFTVPLGSFADTPKKGGTLSIVHSQFVHLNSAIQSGVATMVPGAQIFAGLIRLDEKFQPVPYLAKSWETSSDGLTWTFRLVNNATFHDGKPITSEDVAFSLETVKKNHPFGVAMFGAVDRVETPDPHTAVFKLNKPTPSLLPSLSPVLMSIIPKHVYSSPEPIRTHPANIKPVGSGPFKFSDYKPGEYLILDRYDKFFIPGRPYLDRLIFHIMKDPTSVAISLERQRTHYQAYAAISRDIDRLEKLDHIKVTRKGYEAIGPLSWVAFNVRNKPLDDIQVRQAISYSIDRKFINQKLHMGRSAPATGPLHHGSPFYSGDVEKYDLNLDKANKLLDQAGYPRKDKGIRFSLMMDYEPTSPEVQKNIAEYIREALQPVGIDVKLRTSPDFPTWTRRISNWDFDLTIDTVFNYPDPVIGVHRTYICSNIKKGVMWSNTQGYCNPKVDEILEKASMEKDFVKRKALYAEFQKMVTQELPVAWTFELPYHTLYHRDLGNPPLTVWGAMGPFDEVFWVKEPK
ncbi:MAG: extracellular solute-binding protein family 5 [Deltaproteobacteria bacterium]|nr:extracellular solute-binding protein family 5 [Deltaproteobacteria bacterium]